MEDRKKDNSVKIDAREMGYYSYEETAAVLQISLRTVDTYCKTYNIIPKTGITDNRKKYLTKKDIVTIFVKVKEKKRQTYNISEINWELIEDSISAKDNISAKKDTKKHAEHKEEKETQEGSVPKKRSDEFIDADFKHEEEESSNEVLDYNKNKGYMDDLLGLKERSGKQEAIIEHQSEAIAGSKKKIMGMRLAVWGVVIIGIVVGFFVSKGFDEKETEIVEISANLQKREKEKFVLETTIMFAEKESKFAEKRILELQKITSEYKSLLGMKEKSGEVTINDDISDISVLSEN